MIGLGRRVLLLTAFAAAMTFGPGCRQPELGSPPLGAEERTPPPERSGGPDLSDIDIGRVNSTSLLVLNAVGALLPAFVLMPIAHRIGRVRTHTLSLACMTAGYVGLWLNGASAASIYALMAVVGIGWAAIVSLPFAIVSQKVSRARMGLYMGLFNLSVVLPQLVVSLGIALLVSRAPDKNVIFALSAASLALSTIAWSFVRED